MPNTVEALWKIELLYGKHPSYTESTYVVKLTTKLEGGASKCFLVIDLRDKFDEFLRDFNVFGSMEKAELHQTNDYVKHLKINGLFRRVPNLLTELEGSDGADESLELFSMVTFFTYPYLTMPAVLTTIYILFNVPLDNLTTQKT